MKHILPSCTIELTILFIFFEKYYSLITLANVGNALKDISAFDAMFTRLQKYGDASDREIAEECLGWLRILEDNLFNDIREP